MTELDDATKEACRFINGYYADLGPCAPDTHSRECQHAIQVLASYIRSLNQKEPR